MQYPLNAYPPNYMTGGMTQPIIHTLPQQIPPPPLPPVLHCTQPPMPSYNCNFLEQLQGMYEMDTDEGPDRIHVLMPTFENQGLRNQGCTIVRRVCSDGDALSDQMILEEPNRFILCSIDQDILAYMPKGKDMKNGITWTSTENAHDFIWQRSGQVTFKFVSATKLNRTNPQMHQDISST